MVSRQRKPAMNQVVGGSWGHERALHNPVPTLDEHCERGDPPVTGRSPRTKGPRILRTLLPVSMSLLGKRAREKT